MFRPWRIVNRRKDGGRAKLRLKIDLQKVIQNTKVITGLCAEHGITVVGVAKSCCGMPEVAKAMLAGGVEGLADSRIPNIKRMKEAGVKSSMMLLRSPALSETADAVRLADVSLNSELQVVAALAQEVRTLGKLHQVILMVDVGDRREGLMPGDVVDVATKVEEMEGVRLLGLGSNIGCLSDICPSAMDTQLLVQFASRVEEAIGRQLAVISGGSSIHLPMVEQGRLPPRINQLRIGERILLGTDPGGSQFSSFHTSQDAFSLAGEVIEVKWKPPLPEGYHGNLGGTPLAENQPLQCRAILALGQQDVKVEGLRPKDPGVKVIGATSDHLVVDVTPNPTKVGDELEFGLTYAALTTAMASPYVRKEVMRDA
jgi:predicted amino acid racemase